jgi:AraC-like DNA-binding protein
MSASSRRKTDWRKLARQANYSTAALADLCGISVRHLEREFSRTFGQTPRQWIGDLRFYDARALLEKGHTVKTAAVSLGYNHSPSFSRAFKQFFGVAPSGVRPASNALET